MNEAETEAFITSNSHRVKLFSPEFWKQGLNLFEAADRFDLTTIVKEYLRDLLKDYGCSEKDCLVCFNVWVFSIYHKVGDMFWYDNVSFFLSLA